MIKGTPYPIILKNPDTGNLKFKFEILQGDGISRTNQITIIRARSGDWLFYFYSRHWLVYATGTVVVQVQYAPSLHLFFLFPIYSSNYFGKYNCILAFDPSLTWKNRIFILVSRCVSKVVWQMESFLLFYFNSCETSFSYLDQS